MSRRVPAFALAAVALVSACSDGRGPGAVPPTTAIAPDAVEAGLLTRSQLRRVPGFSTAAVTPATAAAAFRGPGERGPCGGPLPTLALGDAAGVSWQGNTILEGAQVVVRGPARELQRYVAARIRDTATGCPAFVSKTETGGSQEMKFERAIPVSREADQSLAVVTAVRVEGAVRAVTTIDIRVGDLLSRSVVLSERPLPNATVRGLGSLMTKSLVAAS